jgi:hypothetical protein
VIVSHSQEEAKYCTQLHIAEMKPRCEGGGWGAVTSHIIQHIPLPYQYRYFDQPVFQWNALLFLSHFVIINHLTGQGLVLLGLWIQDIINFRTCTSHKYTRSSTERYSTHTKDTLQRRNTPPFAPPRSQAPYTHPALDSNGSQVRFKVHS